MPRETGPDGTQGEIQARGNWLFQGYFGAPEKTAETFTADGWFKTGDIAVERPDGNWQIVGRMKEMYKSGGFNIYPREIEIALEAHPDVAMAAVLGVADPLYHETGHAFVQPQPGAALSADECTKWCKDQLANYKVPKRFTIMAELPRFANGKLDKIGLRKQLEALTGSTPLGNAPQVAVAAIAEVMLEAASHHRCRRRLPAVIDDAERANRNDQETQARTGASQARCQPATTARRCTGC